MEYISRAEKILVDAESALRRVLSDAAAAGNYDSVVRITEMAREIENLRRAAVPASNEGLSSEKSTAGNLPISTRARKKYPYFFRTDEWLVKVGWSKTHKAEYEHKAPKAVLTALLLALDSHRRRNGKFKFSTEQIFPLLDLATQAVIPDYQSYLCLAWLCSIGAVDREGRQGYRITTRQPVTELVESSWSAVPEK